MPLWHKRPYKYLLVGMYTDECQPDSKAMDFYPIENDGGVFEINLINTIETAEGFGARKFAMAEGLSVPQRHRSGLTPRACVPGCNW